MDTAHDRPPASDTPSMPTETELRAMMEQSARDVAGDRTVPLTDVLAELDAVADRIEAQRRARRG